MIKTYALYHIPGRKVGVTNNIEDRVIRQQGYDEGEFEILAWSDDIGYISDLEREMQVAYGYRVDRKLYKDLFNNNNIDEDALFIEKERLLRGRDHLFDLENPPSNEIDKAVNAMRTNLIRFAKEISNQHKVVIRKHKSKGEFKGILIQFIEVSE